MAGKLKYLPYLRAERPAPSTSAGLCNSKDFCTEVQYFIVHSTLTVRDCARVLYLTVHTLSYSM